MANEYVEVKFTEYRKVYAKLYENSEPKDLHVGYTNEIFRIDTGEHTFHLGEPNNYSPPTRKEMVKNTNPLRPKEVIFEEV
jgi:hypothetical protein